MASSFIQFRADEKLKEEASIICNKLGIDLQTYMRMCLARLVSNNGIPFEMVLGNKESIKDIQILQKISDDAKRNKISDMTLDEINKEIEEARK